MTLEEAQKLPVGAFLREPIFPLTCGKFIYSVVIDVTDREVISLNTHQTPTENPPRWHESHNRVWLEESSKLSVVNNLIERLWLHKTRIA